MSDKVVLGQMIKKLRKEKRITQEALAEKLGLKQSAITGYETGVSSPSFDGLVKMADVFEVSLDHLVYGHPENDHISTSDNHKTDEQIRYVSKDEQISILIKDLSLRMDELQECKAEVKRLKNGGPAVYGK